MEKLWKSKSLPAAVMVASIVIAYLPVLHAGFVWDDDDHLTRNPCIVGPLGLKEVWTTTRAVYYPLVLTTFWAVHKLAGLQPLPYHLLNLLVHAGSALLLWRVLRNLNVTAPWFGALLWALHPVMVQSVAWVTELKNTQSCLFYLGSILFFLKADGQTGPAMRRVRTSLYLLSLLFFAMALTSKPSTVMLPVVLGLCLWWKHGRFDWRQLPSLIPFLVIAAAAASWTVFEQLYDIHSLGPDWNATLLQRLGISGRDIWFYLAKLFWPHPLIFIYPRWQLSAGGLGLLLPFAAAAAGFSILWWRREGALRPVFFAAAYFVVLLFPVLGFFNVYFFKYSFVSDHFQYLASMGPLSLLAATIWTGLWRLNQKTVGTSIAGALLFVLAFLTWNQTTTYASVETLYRTTIERNPRCWMAYYNLGIAMMQRGQIDDAIVLSEKAAEIRPNDETINIGLGNLLFQKGRPDEATKYYERAIEIAPMSLSANVGIGFVRDKQGDGDAAIVHYRRALEVAPNSPAIHCDLASVLFRQGKTGDAIVEARRTLALQTDNADAHVILGNALLEEKSVDEAIKEYSEALSLKPDDADTHYNLGNALLQKGDVNNAEVHFERALALVPEMPEAHIEVGGIFARKKDNQRAVAEYELAAAAYARTKQFDKAVTAVQEALQLVRQDGDGARADALQKEIEHYQAGLPYQKP